MNILDLNEDIMSKVKHNIFLRRLMKHREDNFNYDNYEWDKWEFINDYDIFYLENGDRGKSFLFEDDDNSESGCVLNILYPRLFIWDRD
eukprot:SAG11_NODE_6569_length_1286_cov_47.063184_1_plen_89_part_00